MLFSSANFLFIFLPIVLAVYYLPFGRKYKNAWLFLTSLYFYGWGEPVYLLLMVFSITINYVFGLLLEKFDSSQGKRKFIVALSVVVNLSLIGVFKYSGLFVTSLNGLFNLSIPVPQISLPIGISFYTFQIMTYVLDVYRRDEKTQHSYINLGTYITMFPQLIAGPIVRYGDIAEQLVTRVESVARFNKGIRIFIIGLGKKLLIANSCAFIADKIIDDFGGAGTAAAWVGIIAYSFQIFFDFSGYSTMAIGLGEMLGFRMPPNFNFPYIARSVTDFWRRWHMTLSTFFRDYLYIPLGGNRVKFPRYCFNLLIVWFATGLWHGASYNFILWGLYYGVLILIEKIFLGKVFKKVPALGVVFTIAATIFGWIIFRITDLSQIGAFIKLLFGIGTGEGTLLSFGVLPYLPWLVVGAVFSTPLPRRIFQWINKSTVGKLVFDILLGVIFFYCVAAVITESYNPFIYFRF